MAVVVDAYAQVLEGRAGNGDGCNQIGERGACKIIVATLFCKSSLRLVHNCNCNLQDQADQTKQLIMLCAVFDAAIRSENACPCGIKFCILPATIMHSLA